MCAKLAELLSDFTDNEDDNSSSIRDVLDKYLYHWPLFVLGLIITLICAYLYIQVLKPVYEVKATLLIKDKTKSPDDKSSLEELNVSSSPKLAESEIEVLNSRNLIYTVVNDLRLWVNYQFKDGLRSTDLYKTSPVYFKLLDSVGKLGGQSFTIKIKNKRSFLLKTSDGDFKEFLFGARLENAFGIWMLEPTAALDKFIDKEVIITVNDPNIVAQDYQKAIEPVLTNKLAPAIDLTLKDQVEQRGKDILNDLIKNYNLNNISEKNHITQNTLDFIDKRIGSIADELNNSEKELQNFRSKKGVTDIALQSRAYLDNIHDNDAKLNEVNVQLNIIDNIEKYLDNPQSSQNSPVSLGPNYPVLNDLVRSLSTLQLEHDKLLSGNTPEANPAYKQNDKQIKTVKQAIKDNIQNTKANLQAAKDKLEAFNAKFESSMQSIPGQERELIDKTRQKDIKATLYTYLLQKREEIEMSYASTLPDAQIVDYAYSSYSNSRRSIIYGVAFLIGLIISAVFIYLRDSILNNRVTTSKEIEEITGTSLFGELSYARSSAKLIFNSKNNFTLGEEFRALRTSLNFIKGKRDKGMVVLLTSSIPNEGKSFISSNLGYILGLSGRKTVILEMDLRKPKILDFFDVTPSRPGITDYLLTRAKKEEIIQKTAILPNIDLIGSGSQHDEPSELLGLEELDSLIYWLKMNYDYVIIDSPPVNVVTDAKLLSRVCDITLYVIRQSFTYKSLLPFIKSLVKEKKLPELKFIFNAVKKGKYGYGYDYGREYYNRKSTNALTSVFSNFSSRF